MTNLETAEPLNRFRQYADLHINRAFGTARAAARYAGFTSYSALQLPFNTC